MMRKLGRIGIVVLLIAIFGAFCSIACGFASGEMPINSISVPIVMYHNVVKDKPNKYEVTVATLEEDLKYLKRSGYTTISPELLAAYVQGARIIMPKRPIMLTFDDGFYNYKSLLMPLLDKYNAHAVIGVVGEFTQFNKNTVKNKRYTYVDLDDIAELNDSGRVSIANHSNMLHKIVGGRIGASKLKGEDSDKYKKMFKTDTQEWSSMLSKIGIKPLIYTYPYGIACKESEEVLQELGYSMSLTCEERNNHIRVGADNTLRRLGRYNRAGDVGSMAQLAAKFDA